MTLSLSLSTFHGRWVRKCVFHDRRCRDNILKLDLRVVYGVEYHLINRRKVRGIWGVVPVQGLQLKCENQIIVKFCYYDIFLVPIRCNSYFDSTPFQSFIKIFNSQPSSLGMAHKLCCNLHTKIG